jgi:Zn-dependent membrane protease YugP
MFFDPVYFLFLAPAILLTLWAQYRIQSAYSSASNLPARSGLSGAQAAQAVMHQAGVQGVQVEAVEGYLTDHYVPGEKVLRLSADVYAGRSLAALGVAAHESGHAIQDDRRYPLLVVRNLLVPAAGFGGNISWALILLGIVLSSLGVMFGLMLIKIGIVAFSATVLFQLVNLPVEFDASRRARLALVAGGLVSREEDETVGKVLNAAALTYVAATLTSILTLLYFLFRAGLLGGSSSD